MSSPYTLRWGIIATGGISTSFAKDLSTDPTKRNASDIKHVVTAVGSRSTSSAQKFIDSVLANSSSATTAKPYGSYDDVFASDEVDVVYIGTPHTMHYENTKAALYAGKHVLCEKPFTFDLPELDELIKIAKEKKLFLMEAVWTRFHPIAYELQKIIFSGKYGKVRRIFADLSMDFNPDQLDLSNRMIAPELGGGALLDLGPYPMVWTMLLMHQHPDNRDKSPPSSIIGTMIPYERTGVDGHSTWILEWANMNSIAICTASITTQMSTARSVSIHLDRAEITIDFPTYRPQGYTILEYPGRGEWSEDKLPPREGVHHDCVIPETDGRGMQYQADEVARCIRDGKTESERCGLEESRIVMQVFDEVRKQGKYPVKEGKAGKTA